MAGAPSQLDMFDNKPTLRKYDGQDIPAEIVKGERFAFIKGTPKILGSPFDFRRHGQSGQEISDLLPHLATIADDIAIVKSMQTTQFNHAPAQIFMNTGHQVIGRPSMGSWLSYGLGIGQQGPAGLRRAALAARTTPTAASRAGAPASCRPSIRAWSSAAARSGAVRLESGRRRRAAATRVARRAEGPERHASGGRRATRRSRRASTRTNSPTGCRPACRS